MKTTAKIVLVLTCICLMISSITAILASATDSGNSLADIVSNAEQMGCYNIDTWQVSETDTSAKVSNIGWTVSPGIAAIRALKFDKATTFKITISELYLTGVGGNTLNDADSVDFAVCRGDGTPLWPSLLYLPEIEPVGATDWLRISCSEASVDNKFKTIFTYPDFNFNKDDYVYFIIKSDKAITVNMLIQITDITSGSEVVSFAHSDYSGTQGEKGWYYLYAPYSSNEDPTTTDGGATTTSTNNTPTTTGNSGDSDTIVVGGKNTETSFIARPLGYFNQDTWQLSSTDNSVRCTNWGWFVTPEMAVAKAYTVKQSGKFNFSISELHLVSADNSTLNDTDSISLMICKGDGTVLWRFMRWLDSKNGYPQMDVQGKWLNITYAETKDYSPGKPPYPYKEFYTSDVIDIKAGETVYFVVKSNKKIGVNMCVNLSGPDSGYSVMMFSGTQGENNWSYLAIPVDTFDNVDTEVTTTTRVSETAKSSGTTKRQSSPGTGDNEPFAIMALTIIAALSITALRSSKKKNPKSNW